MKLDMRGIEERHQATCPVRSGGKTCSCVGGPTFRAKIMQDGRVVRETFRDARLAVQWRASAEAIRADGLALRPSDRTPLREHMTTLLDAIEGGAMANKNGYEYKPSVAVGYRRHWKNHLDAEVGALYPRQLTRAVVKQLIKKLRAKGLSSSSIRNILMPLRVLYRELIADEIVEVSPLAKISLPKSDEVKRERVASTKEFAWLLPQVPDEYQGIYACAGYAGLRVGEIRGLLAELIDWDRGDRGKTHSRPIFANCFNAPAKPSVTVCSNL